MNAPLLFFATVSSWVIGWCAFLTLARGGGNRCDAQSLTLLDGAPCRKGDRTMKRIAMTLALGLLAACSAQHDHQRAGDIVVSVPWSREVPKGGSVAVGYVTLENTGKVDDRLLRVETAAAKRVEMHETRNDGGIMRMRMLSDGLAIPAGRTVVLGPSGTHLMFIDPKRPVVAGDTLDAVLVFRSAGRAPIAFDVRELGAADRAGVSHMHH